MRVNIFSKQDKNYLVFLCFKNVIFLSFGQKWWHNMNEKLWSCTLCSKQTVVKLLAIRLGPWIGMWSRQEVYLCIHTNKRLWYTDKAYILAKQQGNMCLDLCFLLPWKPPTLQLNIYCQSAALPVRQISENIPFTSFGIDSWNGKDSFVYGFQLFVSKKPFCIYVDTFILGLEWLWRVYSWK